MTSTRPSRFPWVLAVALAASACAEGGGSTRSVGGGQSSRSADSGPPAIEGFPQETQAFMKAGLHQFSQGDPKWEMTRAEWLAKGPDEADFLVATLWAALLKAQALDQPKLVERARHELAQIGEPSIPMMAAFVAGGTVYTTTDPDSGEKRDIVIDDMARDEASQILSLIGAPAVPAVCGALSDAASKAGKRCALQTLGYLGDRGGAAAIDPLLEYARSEDDVLRMEAVYSMRFCHDDATRAVLLQSLGDGDDLVRRRAAEALATRRDAGAVQAIRAAADRARSEAKFTEASELNRAATYIEQHQK